MESKTTIDVFDLVAAFQHKIDQEKPTASDMYRDVAMMKFKIRPLRGNVFNLNLKDAALIDALWRLGRLDQFYHDNFDLIPRNDRNIFFKLVNEMRAKYQRNLLSTTLDQPEMNGDNAIEMEIFRERKEKELLN